MVQLPNLELGEGGLKQLGLDFRKGEGRRQGVAVVPLQQLRGTAGVALYQLANRLGIGRPA